MHFNFIVITSATDSFKFYWIFYFATVKVSYYNTVFAYGCTSQFGITKYLSNLAKRFSSELQEGLWNLMQYWTIHVNAKTYNNYNRWRTVYLQYLLECSFYNI